MKKLIFLLFALMPCFGTTLYAQSVLVSLLEELSSNGNFKFGLVMRLQLDTSDFHATVTQVYATNMNSTTISVRIPPEVVYNNKSFRVTHIGDNAFSDENGGVIYNDHYYGYYERSNLVGITFPMSITHIGDNAFSGCWNLTEITFPDSLEYLGSGAFRNCRSIKEIIIPNSLRKIESSAFSGCSSLTEITFSDSLRKIDVHAFEYCSSVKEIILPDSLREINNRAFYGCSSLTKITLPDSLREIGERVFDNCSNLRTIYYGNPNPQSYSYDLFPDEVYKNATLYVPCGTSGIYKNKTPWYKFENIVEFAHLITFKADDPAHGSVEVLEEINCDNADYTLQATPAEGYEFTQWSDGNTDNPRQVTVTQDTAFTAEFVKLYTLSITYSPLDDYSVGGYASGNGTYRYGTDVTIRATPFDGYLFDRWSDGNTDNPRHVTLTQDTVFTPVFIHERCSLLLSGDHAAFLDGAGEYDCGSTVTISAYAGYGFRFDRWVRDVTAEDTVEFSTTENPYTFKLTSDMSFTAMFLPRSTATDDISLSGFSAVGAAGGIEIHRAVAPVEVYDIMGRKVYAGTDSWIALSQSGVYIVRHKEQTVKVVVR